jgi:heterotetrameric sarcosine oxidase gamma subunit
MASREQAALFKHQRASVLAEAAVPGRFGADRGAPGVVLSIIHPVDMVMVMVRKGKAKALADALANWRGADVRWAGPDQYFVLGKSFDDAAKKLEGLASCVDQSHGRVMIGLTGPKARAVLAKGTPVDLHPDAFPIGILRAWGQTTMSFPCSAASRTASGNGLRARPKSSAIKSCDAAHSFELNLRLAHSAI